MLKRYGKLSYAISRISRSIQKIERDEMLKYGFRGAFTQYLLALRSHPEGLTAVQLSEICDKDRAAISRIVSEMEAKGLVVRESANNDKMYRALICLTGEGRRAAEFINGRAVSAIAAAGNGLTDEKRKIFYEALELITANLERISRDGIPD